MNYKENLPTVIIFGRTNVGKSTLFNCLTEKNKALVSKIEGTTRDSNIGEVEWCGRAFTLIDTGGIINLPYLIGKKITADNINNIDAQVQKQARDFLTRADLILFLVDTKAGLLPMDKQMSLILKKITNKKKFILVANKADSMKQREKIAEFYKLSLGDPIPVSAVTGSGTGDLLDIIIKKIAETKSRKSKSLPKEEAAGEKPINVCLLGRPNVGKSSLFNQLVGRDRAIIHHEPGTTRDLITETVVWQGLSFHLTDAAGIRDQAGDVETIGIDRAKALLGRADLVVYVKDATCLEESDMKGLNPKQTILCINKIDQFSLSSSGALSLSSSGLTGGSSFLENNKKWLACVQTSATQEIGINDLKEMIVVNALKERSVRSDQEGVIITSARHKAALDQTITSLKQSIHEVNQKQSAEFIALHLNQASDALGHIIGVVTSDDILNQIFSRFCIGK